MALSRFFLSRRHRFRRGAQLYANYVFEPSYKLHSIADHSEYLGEHKHPPAIAGVKKDAEGREVVNLGGQQRGIVQELGEAHIYIAQLNKQLPETRTQLAKERKPTALQLKQLKEEIGQLAKRMANQ